MGTDGSRHSVGRCESECDLSHVNRFHVFPSLFGTLNICNNEINGRVAGQGTSQFLDDIFKQLYLPQFPDPIEQTIVHFVDDLESYFLLMGLQDSFNLVLARRAVVDCSTSQWINRAYKDLSSYEQCREAITEFL